ncbi:MAG: hypothetical protein AB7N71_03010 [Phycisphaerae bacterium]
MSRMDARTDVAPMVLRPSNDGPLFQLRMDEYEADRVHKTAPIELLLPTWDFDSVLIVAVMVRLSKSPQWTYELWLDGTTQTGIQALQSIAGFAGASVKLGNTVNARVMRAPNTVRGLAKTVIRRLQSWSAWEQQAYDDALRQIQRLYPTPHELWLEARRR